MTAESTGLWQLGDWQYLPDTGELFRGQQSTRLSTQLNEVLWLLIQNAPEVVTREVFLEQIWVNKWVNEDALSRTIAELRKILGDSASQAKYIKTIPKKGYQLTQTAIPVKTKRKQLLNAVLAILGVFILLLFTYFYSQQETTAEQLQKAVTNASRVTALPGMERQSTMSSDGQWLSYVKYNSQGSQIIVKSLDDASLQHVVELARHWLGSPLFLPEQDLLIFTARDQTVCYLKSYHLKTRQFKDMAACEFNSESRTLTWNERAQSIAFAGPNQQGLVGIMQVMMNTGEQTVLTTPPSIDVQDWSPEFSQDQTFLSFSRGNQSVRNLWLKNLITGEEWALTQGEHYTISHTWYDNEHIVFDSDLSGSRQLWIININEQVPQLLGAYGAQHPAFDQARSRMTFQEVSYEANIWLYDVSSDGFNRVIHSTKYDNYPVFSPNGNQFLFSSNRMDQSAIWLYDLSSQEEKLLVSIEGAKLTRPSWHHTEEKVLMTINDDRGYGTLILDLNSQEKVELDFGHAHMAAEEHQGDYYALAKSVELNNQILKLSDDGVEVFPVQFVSRFMVSDSGLLIYSKTAQDGLFGYDQKNQQERLITDQLRSTAFNFWTVVNEAVYFDRGGEFSGIWRLDLSNGAMQKVTEHRPFSVGTSLSVSNDESQLLITRTDRAESDILRVNLKP